jgi:hypothetical protein
MVSQAAQKATTLLSSVEAPPCLGRAGEGVGSTWSNQLAFKSYITHEHQWFSPVILATWESETWGTMVPGQ